MVKSYVVVVRLQWVKDASDGTPEAPLMLAVMGVDALEKAGIVFSPGADGEFVGGRHVFLRCLLRSNIRIVNEFIDAKERYKSFPTVNLSLDSPWPVTEVRVLREFGPLVTDEVIDRLWLLVQV